MAPGVDIRLTWAGPDGILGTDDDEVFTTTTDAGGGFMFPNLPPGLFRIDIDPTGLPVGFQVAGGTSIELNVAPGEAVTDINVGLRQVGIPTTGTSAVPTVQLALLLIAFGAALLAVTRRRRVVA